jgi:AcrR family transcriptional regulator
MGRNRTIDREAVLDAAQKVVSRDGATGLTLDAVAAEAGISKASVLYDCKTKHALIEAVIERQLATEAAEMDAVVERLGPSANLVIEAQILNAFTKVSDEDRAVAMHLCAAMAQDDGLRVPIRAHISARINDIMMSSQNPRGAQLAFLALEGLKLLDWFGLHSWPDDERTRILGEIRWLIDQQPEPVPLPIGAAPS